MRCLLPLLLAALSLACTKSESPPQEQQQQQVPQPEDPEPTPKPAPSPAPCQDDLDCITCSTERGCGCVLGPPQGKCGPTLDSCVVDPCMRRSASCWQGKCVMREGKAGPCTTDEQCEVRADRCQCDLYAALTSAPQPERGCVGVSCGTQPNPAQFEARCDMQAHRCVLDRRMKIPKFELELSCETHGVAITTHRVALSSDPASITIDEGKANPLEVRTLGTLWSVIDSEDFRTFLDETPKEGPPHPGMKHCTLSIQSSTVAVEAKTWSTADEFTEAAAEARQAMHEEIGALESRTRPTP